MLADKVVGSVCHGPAAFVNVKISDNYMLKGKEVTSFSNSEEKSLGKDKVQLRRWMMLSYILHDILSTAQPAPGHLVPKVFAAPD